MLVLILGLLVHFIVEWQHYFMANEAFAYILY